MNTVTVQSLQPGDRFTNAGRLYTYLEPSPDGESAIVRHHSDASRKLGHSGFGYYGDSICSIPLISPVEFEAPDSWSKRAADLYELAVSLKRHAQEVQRMYGIDGSALVEHASSVLARTSMTRSTPE